MILRHKFGSWRITFAVIRTETTQGLNSKLADGSHILMWEFDDANLKEIDAYLHWLQKEARLPNIYIFMSSEPNNYHGLCLYRATWPQTIMAARCIPGIDEQWFKGGVVRGYFTLRIGIKAGQEPKPDYVIKSHWPDVVNVDELVNYDEYETRLAST